MSRIALITVITAALLGGGVANATETRRFTGEGSSDFGFQLDYARAHARSQADAAGFPHCREISAVVKRFDATVVWECTR